MRLYMRLYMRLSVQARHFDQYCGMLSAIAIVLLLGVWLFSCMFTCGRCPFPGSTSRECARAWTFMRQGWATRHDWLQDVERYFPFDRVVDDAICRVWIAFHEIETVDYASKSIENRNHVLQPRTTIPSPPILHLRSIPKPTRIPAALITYRRETSRTRQSEGTAGAERQLGRSNGSAWAETRDFDGRH